MLDIRECFRLQYEKSLYNMIKVWNLLKCQSFLKKSIALLICLLHCVWFRMTHQEITRGHCSTCVEEMMSKLQCWLQAKAVTSRGRQRIDSQQGGVFEVKDLAEFALLCQIDHFSLAGEFFPEAAQIAYKMWELSSMTKVQVWLPSTRTLDVSLHDVWLGHVWNLEHLLASQQLCCFASLCQSRVLHSRGLCFTLDMIRIAALLEIHFCCDPPLQTSTRRVNVREVSALLWTKDCLTKWAVSQPAVLQPSQVSREYYHKIQCAVSAVICWIISEQQSIIWMYLFCMFCRLVCFCSNSSPGPWEPLFFIF